MSRELVSTEFDDRRISVIVHRSVSDKLAVESFTRLACLGPSLIPVKERERVSGKVSNQSRICELVSGKTHLVLKYTQLYAPYNFICA